MNDKEFEELIKNKRRNLHNDNIQDLIGLAINPDALGEDLEYGEVGSGVQSSTSSYIPTINVYNGKFPVPRPQINVSRHEYHQKMAKYYNERKNFMTLGQLDDKKFKLLHGEAQNHFTPELIYYAGILYDEIINKIPDKDGGRLIITSGFRSIDYNDNLRESGHEGVSTWSAHSGGMAIDIVCSKRENRIKILDAAYRIGFGGLGLYDTFVHVDVSGRSMWGGYSAPNGG